MQNLKDSFYSALHDRLAALNPARTVVIEGVVRPAIVSSENEIAASGSPFPNTFYLHWGNVQMPKNGGIAPQPFFEMECDISYWTEGSSTLSFQDRGRLLSALDDELLSITLPNQAQLKDFSQTPAVDLGTAVFWIRPELQKLTEDGRKLLRVAKVKVFYSTEVTG